jgi:2-polyprenyl-3-methyl-5-hydroxy-6-metoxy-1,4-benzoquinol methylase
MDSFPRGDLVEIGCGSGALLYDLDEMGFSCKGIEISAAALEIARYVNRSSANVTIWRKAQEEWQYKFDYVLALEVLEHIENDLGALQQWASLLKPNGGLLVSVPAHPRLWDAYDLWAGHFRRYQRDGLRRLLEYAGFSVQKIECIAFPLGNILAPIRAYHRARLRGREEILEVEEDQRMANTKRSGVERPIETKLYHLQASWVGTKIMQLFCVLQGWFTRTELGTTYIALARLQ